VALNLIRAYGGGRLDAYPPQPTDDEDEEPDESIDHAYERPPDDWTPIDTAMPNGWRPRDWPLCPARFVDGKDEGEIVTCPFSPQGHPIPVRLSEIGAVVMRVDDDGEVRREFAVTERVVSFVAEVYPWSEVEAFAAALQEAGLRLLPARPPGERPSYDYEKMRKAAQNRSLTEMGALEEAALGIDADVPTVVDGRLEPRVGGFDQAHSPVFGVIKTHAETYLHALGFQILYGLKPGERTPAFALRSGDKRRLSVVSWYVRLAGGPDSMPSWGYVRVEAPLRWFEEQRQRDFGVLDRLSQTLYRYRCLQRSYARAPVSLHPIVRGEASLGALFTPFGALKSRFYRLNGL
jgi:hypothetical protein